jgi:hypothetical protein
MRSSDKRGNVTSYDDDGTIFVEVMEVRRYKGCNAHACEVKPNASSEVACCDQYLTMYKLTRKLSAHALCKSLAIWYIQ